MICATLAMAHRPFTRRQALQNQAFLEALRATGNPRLAARLLGVHRSTYTKRRAKSAAFAQDWDAALAAAHARFHLAGGPRPPEAKGGLARPSSASLRTEGGELFVGRTRGGRLQLRRAPPGWMTKAGEQAFFRALSATANVRLSAAATGFSPSSFYARRRRWGPFRIEMGHALKIGYDRIEYAAMERTLQALDGGGAENGWLERAIVGNPLPPISFDQAFQILCLHRNTVRLDGERPPGRRARIAHDPAAAMFAIARNIDALQRAGHYERTGEWRFPHEPAPPALPPLGLVTGWSKANPDRAKATYNPDLALFGGWRLEDWEKRKAGKR